MKNNYKKALRIAAEEAYKSEVVDTDMVGIEEVPEKEWIEDRFNYWLKESQSPSSGARRKG